MANEHHLRVFLRVSLIYYHYHFMERQKKTFDPAKISLRVLFGSLVV